MAITIQNFVATDSVYCQNAIIGISDGRGWECFPLLSITQRTDHGRPHRPVSDRSERNR